METYYKEDEGLESYWQELKEKEEEMIEQINYKRYLRDLEEEIEHEIEHEEKEYTEENINEQFCSHNITCDYYSADDLPF